MANIHRISDGKRCPGSRDGGGISISPIGNNTWQRLRSGAAAPEIAAGWPCNRKLRVYEPGSSRLSDRLQRAGIPVTRPAKGQPCDLALFIEAGTLDASSINLAPGGAGVPSG